MTGTAIVVRYGGTWTESNKYENSKFQGVILPQGCNFDMLKSIISNEMKINTKYSALDIKFQLEDGDEAFDITNDMSLSFYLQLKNNETDVRKYPLCITCVQLNENDENNIQQGDQCSENWVHSLTYQHDEHQQMDMIEYVNQVTQQTITNLENNFTYRCNKEVSYNPTIIHDLRHSNFETGQKFKDKYTLKTSISFYAINMHFQFKTERSNARQLYLSCIDDSCTWIMRASKCGNTDTFQIKKLVDSHTCRLDIRFSGKRQATRYLIGECIKYKYVDIHRTYTPRDIIDDVRLELGVDINYQKAWKSKEKAVEIIRGKPGDSYAMLSSYLYMVKQTNPGSVVEMHTDVNNSFVYAFMALHASIMGWKYCKPMLVVDGSFLKATYGGTLLTACTKDASGSIFPLAFGVVDSENNAAYDWFFIKFKEAYGDRESLTIVSDRHESIARAARKIYPQACHCVCMYHLLNNLKSNFRKDPKKISENFIGAAESYTIKDFESYMAELDKVDAAIRPYLADIGYERWSRCHCPNSRSSSLTSNIVESLNAVNKAARELPVTCLFEHLRGLTQEWSVSHRLIAASTMTNMTTAHEMLLRENYIRSQSYKVKESNEHVYSAFIGNDNYIVNLAAKTCICNHFQIDEIPCEHALAVIRYKHLNSYKFCSPFYSKEYMKATYQYTVFAIPKQDVWDVPEEIKNRIVHPPKGKAPPGRPRKRRFKQPGEKTSKNRCTRCGKKGHNKKTCHNAPQ